MIVQEAVLQDMQEVMDFYDFMCQELGKTDLMPNGNKGGFPSVQMVRSAIEAGQLCIGREDGRLMAAYILSHDAAPAYRQVRWGIDAPEDKVSVLHALRVHPQYTGRGYASYLLDHAVRTAREKGQYALRLDCLVENEIPRRMYLSHGFTYMDTVEIFYEDIGQPRSCLLFEMLL